MKRIRTCIKPSTIAKCIETRALIAQLPLGQIFFDARNPSPLQRQKQASILKAGKLYKISHKQKSLCASPILPSSASDESHNLNNSATRCYFFQKGSIDPGNCED